ncbi:hypothetical protein [Clostridium estertheticum]|uniref:hypothetical protein n=1 Tax=Clostridium estertheticum TaxID=238834 RepID=UPI001C7CB086|nr:hypothetical protein [Clostridium estertheticum]MBX4265464.1 hypothetical protein [Clostridium estertheticum]WLC90185.1 hypothetical protein KTC95_08380 [Clostridium estertheticum]
MKGKIIRTLTKLIANILAIWFVFSKTSKMITVCLSWIGIADQKAIIAVVASFWIFLFDILMLFLDWLIQRILVNPINLEINFLDNDKKELRFLKIKLPDDKIKSSNLSAQYSVQLSISGGSFLTNKLLSWLGGYVRIAYNSNAYETEAIKGWLVSDKLKSNLYKDEKSHVYYYWTDSINECSKKIEQEDAIIYRTELIINPKRMDIPRCNVNVKICSSENENICKILLFNLLKKVLIKSTVKCFQIILE